MNNIRTILAAMEQATGITPQAFSSRTISQLPSVSYIAYPQSDNAVVESWRLQTRVTAESFEQAIDIEGAIRENLVTLGGEELHGSLSIQVNGGGTLEDETTGLPQILTYYDIQTKS
jgi:hypothetical protein